MLRIAIAGLGTVGAGVVRLLHQNGELISARCGQPVVIKAVSARDKNRKRDCDLSSIAWVDDPLTFAQMPNIDAVVEVMGGAEGTARALAESTLKNGKHYISANKALIATHGVHLARLAEQAKVGLLFEAAVAGGIPVLKTLREGLAGNKISVVRGIINGTCNYILTRMRDAHLSFADALAEAQDQGYAEKEDPGFDIDGHDAACKLAILTALAFGVEPDMAAIRVEGIRAITPTDLRFAEDLECRIKLLGVARHCDGGGIEQRVGPHLVAKTSPLSEVDGVLNAVALRGDFIGDLMLEGRGAGGDPTASAVVADIMDVACGHHRPAFGVTTGLLKKSALPQTTCDSRYYMRLQVADKPGVVADITAILRDESISIESLLQCGRSATESVPLVITTHEVNADTLARAVKRIATIPTVVDPPRILPIED